MPPSKRSNTAFCCPDEVKFATEGMEGDYWQIYRLLLELFYSMKSELPLELYLRWLPSEWSDLFCGQDVGSTSADPCSLHENVSQGPCCFYLNIPPSHHPHTKPLILPAKVSPLEYISPWLALSGVDYEAREETFSQWKGKLEPGAVMQLQHGNR